MPSVDPFEVLGVEHNFDIDLSTLAKTHRELSRALHPDKFTSAAPSERRLALTKAVEVNEAWRILREPIRRAETLFRLEGIAVGEANEPKASPAFLMDVMEKREALAEAKTERNAKAVRALADEVEERAQRAEEELARGFSRAKGDKAALEALLPKLGQLRFYRRFLDEVSAIEDEIGMPDSRFGHS